MSFSNNFIWFVISRYSSLFVKLLSLIGSGPNAGNIIPQKINKKIIFILNREQPVLSSFPKCLSSYIIIQFVVERKRVDVAVQVIFCIIPYLWIYGFYRIEKLRSGLVLVVATTISSVFLQMFLPFPYGLASALILLIVIPIAFMVNWSKEWNRIISEEKGEETPSSLEILKERYAKGEITKEEFDKMKEDLS